MRDAKHTSPEEAEHRLNVVVNMRKKAGRPVGSSTKKKKTFIGLGSSLRG